MVDPVKTQVSLNIHNTNLWMYEKKADFFLLMIMNENEKPCRRSAFQNQFTRAAYCTIIHTYIWCI